MKDSNKPQILILPRRTNEAERPHGTAVPVIQSKRGVRYVTNKAVGTGRTAKTFVEQLPTVFRLVIGPLKGKVADVGKDFRTRHPERRLECYVLVGAVLIDEHIECPCCPIKLHLGASQFSNGRTKCLGVQHKREERERERSNNFLLFFIMRGFSLFFIPKLGP